MKVKVEIEKDLKGTEVVIKTPDYNDEIKALSTYISQYQNVTDILTIKDERGLRIIEQDKIISVEVLGDELTIQTVDSTHFTRGRLYRIIDKLDSTKFTQVSKSSVININYIERLENYFSGTMIAYMENGSDISVSRSFLPELKKKLYIYKGA